MSTPRPPRCHAAPVLALALLGALLAWGPLSCAEAGHAHRTEIRFWNGFTGPDGRTMLQLVKEFNEQNPDVLVTLQRMDWTTYYNKLFVAGLGGRAPEVFVVHTDALGRYVDAGFVRPLDDLLASAESLPVEDFDEVPWQAATQGGSQFAIPLDVHPVGMYYNKALLREWGFVDEAGNPRPPRDREEFLEVLRVVHRDGHPDKTWGGVIPQYRNLVLSLMRQNGGRFFTEDHGRCTLAEPENVEALQFLVDLVHEERVMPSLDEYSYFDSWIAFRQGKAGVTFDGVYMIGDLRKQAELGYGSAPLPLVFDEPATFAGSHNLCISSASDEDEAEAAWRFIRYLSARSLEWADAGQVPVRKSQRADPAFERMEVQRGFSLQMPYIFYAPQVPFVFEFMAELDLAIEKSIRGRASVEEALLLAQENVDKIIVRQQGGAR